MCVSSIPFVVISVTNHPMFYSRGCCGVLVSSSWVEECKPPPCRRWRLVACKDPGSQSIISSISPLVGSDLNREQSCINIHLSKHLPIFKSLSQWKTKTKTKTTTYGEYKWEEIGCNSPVIGPRLALIRLCSTGVNLTMSQRASRRDSVRVATRMHAHIYRGTQIWPSCWCSSTYQVTNTNFVINALGLLSGSGAHCWTCMLVAERIKVSLHACILLSLMTWSVYSHLSSPIVSQPFLWEGWVRCYFMKAKPLCHHSSLSPETPM